MTDAEKVAAYVRDMYMEVRVLDDGTVAALHDLMYTRAIHLDVDMHGWGRRRCFSDRDLATRVFRSLHSADDPIEGHIASRD